MVEVTMGFTMPKPHIHNPPTFQTTKMEMNQFPKSLRKCSFSKWNTCWLQEEGKRSKRGSLLKANALPDWPLIAVLVQHIEGQRDYIVHKTVWHLNDETLKNVYTMYIMFTCWGCYFFGAMKDPYYDREQYRKDGGDGTGHWVYEKVKKQSYILGNSVPRANLGVLDKLFAACHELAEIMGYKSYAQFAVHPNIASSPEVVMPFLLDLSKIVRHKADEEFKAIRDFKRKIRNEDCADLEPWDEAYFTGMMKSSTFNLDSSVS